MKRESFQRYSLLNPRMSTALAHALFGVVCLHRSNLDLLFRAYAPFGNMTAWGVGLIALAVILVFAPRASFLLMLAQLVSATVFFTIGGLLTSGVGLLPTVGLAAVFALVSLLLFSRSFGQWLCGQGWYVRLLGRPPAWLTRQRWFQHLQQRVGGGDG